ncbi:MAG: hypothetical protein FD183_448, partial [Chitinophagaceae bacterium]
MKKILILFVFGISTAGINAQNNLTPEKLWQIGRVSAMGLSNDKTAVIYSVGIPD